MLTILKTLISLEFLAITTLCFIFSDKYKGKKNKLIRFMPYLFTVVGGIILSTFVGAVLIQRFGCFNLSNT